jgi:glyoxylase-like metal-dependent hydrolase (beta-lactamase superfamily II)
MLASSCRARARLSRSGRRRAIHRIEGDLGERYVCQYLLVGSERSLLMDTGLRDMPDTVIAPYLDRLGALADVDDVLISHADVDHCGRPRAARPGAARAPDVRRGRPPVDRVERGDAGRQLPLV